MGSGSHYHLGAGSKSPVILLISSNA